MISCSFIAIIFVSILLQDLLNRYMWRRIINWEECSPFVVCLLKIRSSLWPFTTMPVQRLMQEPPCQLLWMMLLAENHVPYICIIIGVQGSYLYGNVSQICKEICNTCIILEVCSLNNKNPAANNGQFRGGKI